LNSTNYTHMKKLLGIKCDCVMMSDAPVQQVRYPSCFYSCIFGFFLHKKNRTTYQYHPRRWQISYEQWWNSDGRAVDQPLHQHIILCWAASPRCTIGTRPPLPPPRAFADRPSVSQGEFSQNFLQYAFAYRHVYCAGLSTCPATASQELYPQPSGTPSP
jgi:hypothetical protein